MGSCCSSLEEPSPPYNAAATPKRDYCTPEQPPAYAPRAITVRRDYPTVCWITYKYKTITNYTYFYFIRLCLRLPVRDRS
ncbi:unnamed protein product [Plutella xylostella]|uniref:(diamondback moth) hypothetical protein n=1 Tax=Plutella xylostella TaxID=51655 RepID=A0A8S4GFN7_PLUXY|nr:unnamed protein product [Plutella xylostella]